MNLVRQQFDFFNGFRVTMRPPSVPCKFGVYINTAINEYEHFVGHLVDTETERKSDWVQYEVPLNLMVNNNV